MGKQFTRLSGVEMKNIETRLRNKKLKYKVQDGKIKRKVANKSGKTQFVVAPDKLQKIKDKQHITLLEFCKIYNTEMEFTGQQSFYSKTIRDQNVLNYFFTKGWLHIKEYVRNGEPYFRYWIKQHARPLLLKFFNDYMSCAPVNNEDDIRKIIARNPKAIKNPEKLDDKTDYRAKTGRIIKF